ncbi:MAG: hypothetical protein VW362_06135, partial [Candidatus Nanopelagicales bacterium]
TVLRAVRRNGKQTKGTKAMNFRADTYEELQVANILAVWDRAAATDLADGIEWYARAQRKARQIARTHGIAYRTVVAVMAALSPNNRWERNVIDTDRMCAVFARAGRLDEVSACTYLANREKAWRILEEHARSSNVSHDAIRAILRGPKTSAFYSNIIGLDDWCTIDGHARNIAYAERLGLSSAELRIGKLEYRKLVAAYCEAARRRNVLPSAIQAVTWTTWRREHGIA